MPTTSPNPADGGSKRILVVDDDPGILQSLGDILQGEGYDVTTAPDAIDALEIVRRTSFAVVISDQKMPHVSGLEFLDQAKLLQPNTSRILLTGVVDLKTVLDAINKGELYRFMVKPWLLEELLSTVKNAIHRYELICHNDALQNATRTMNEQLSWLNQALEEKLEKEKEQNRQLGLLNRALDQNLQSSVELCLKTMQSFYPTLGSQARRVYGVCKAMAESLHLSPEQKQILEISAWLHDIGLVGVPRQLIRRWQEKPNSLNEAERALIEHHPITGQELAGFVHHLEAVGTTIRAHHERFDGSGYPDGLKGEQISWLARLLAVAVAYAESRFEGRDAVLDMEVNRGAGFDPEAVRVLTRSLPQALLPRKEKEIMFAELRPGMVLANGIYNAQGLLLIPEGQELSHAAIGKLHAHNRVSTITQSLQVYG